MLYLEEIGAFLEDFRAIKQSSSQHTIFFLSIVLKRVKVKWQCRGFFFKIEHGLFRVIGLKYGGEPSPIFGIFIF